MTPLSEDSVSLGKPDLAIRYRNWQTLILCLGRGKPLEKSD
jgi:hypothetical protein